MKRCHRLHVEAALVLFAVFSVLAARPADAQDREENTVDVELVLAVDVSWSMNEDEQRIQREGYAAAFRSADVQQAIMSGGWGRVAVTYVEWAGSATQNVVVPWTLVDSKESAEAFAYRLIERSPARFRRTSIAAAIDFAVATLDDSPFDGLRRVIDISGDGPNNEGRGVVEARDAAVAAGIAINGLPLMTRGDDGYGFSWGSIEDLDEYYSDCVIGGPAAFMIPVNDWAQFPEAVRRKLVLELAGGWEIGPQDDAGIVMPVQDAGETTDCLIGERLWRERQQRYDFN